MRGRFVRKNWKYDPTLYAPPRYRRACGYQAFVPDPLAGFDFRLPGEVAGVVSDAERAIAELNTTAGPELGPLARLLLRTESIASSKVEGLQVDARTLARAEGNLAAGRKAGPQAMEVLANIDAMEVAIEESTNAGSLTARQIRAIHRVLMENDKRIKAPGEFRTEQNWIGGNDYNPCGAAYVPPPAEHVAQLVHDLCEFSSGDAFPPLVQAAIAHAQFETIHPFIDGNGRAGRALVQVILRRRGLAPAYVPPISVVLAKRRDVYIAGLEQFRKDDLAAWLETFASAAAEASLLALGYRDRVLQLQADWRVQLRRHSDPREDAAAWSIIDSLPGHPVATIALLVAVTGRTRPAVANGVAELEAAGVLRPLGGGRWNRAWEAEGLLELVTALEAGEP